MKQTAVETLYKFLYEMESFEGFDPYNFNQKEVFAKAKQMEKEQMCGFAEFVATYSDKNKNYLGDMLHAKSKYDGAERTIDLLEQYYNETFKSE